MIVYLDKVTHESIFLKETLQSLGHDCEFVVRQEEPLGQDNYVSICEYLALTEEQEIPEGKDLYYAFLDVPPFWQVQADKHLGAIYDMGKKKAQIYFKEPIQRRFVQRVEWFAETGSVYKVDYYNKWGFAGCREWRNAAEKPMLRVYYTSKGEEIISHHMQRGNFTVASGGCVSAVCDTMEALEKYFYKRLIDAGEKIILTSLRQVKLFEEVDSRKTAVVCAIFNELQDIQGYQKMPQRRYPLFVMNNTNNMNCAMEEDRVCYRGKGDQCTDANGDILILTMSEKMYGIDRVLEAFPDATIHIAANTAVSDKVLALQKYSNVRIYPQVPQWQLEQLLEKCSFYLDISYGWEIHHAVIRASMKNMLILGYESTLHNRYYVLEECIFDVNDTEGLLSMLKSLIGKQDVLHHMLKKQRSLSESSRDKLMVVLRDEERIDGALCV